MKKSSRSIIKTIIISIILISAIILSNREVETQRIYSENSIDIGKYSFEFVLVTDRVWGEEKQLRILFHFTMGTNLSNSGLANFDLISFKAIHGNEEWVDGTEVDISQKYYENYSYTVGRKYGPLWDCGSEITVIADIICDLAIDIIYHIEEISSIYCWG